MPVAADLDRELWRIVGIGRDHNPRWVETRGFRPGWGSVARPMFAASTAADGSKF